MILAKALEIRYTLIKAYLVDTYFEGPEFDYNIKNWCHGVPERIYNSHYGNGVPAMFTS